MSKKMLKRSLALGALMAFVITGQAWAGNETVQTIDASVVYTSVVNAEEYSTYKSNFYAGAGENTVVNLTNGQILNVTNTNYTDTGRNYGFTAFKGGNLTVNGNVILTVGNSCEDRAVRHYSSDDVEGGTLKFNGDLTITVKDDEEHRGGNTTIGIDARYSGVKTEVTGDTKITLDTDNFFIAIQNRTNSIMNFGKDLTVVVTSNTDEASNIIHNYHASTLDVAGNSHFTVTDKTTGDTQLRFVENYANGDTDRVNTPAVINLKGNTTIEYENGKTSGTSGYVEGIYSSGGIYTLGNDSSETLTKISIDTHNENHTSETSVNLYGMKSQWHGEINGTVKNSVDIDIKTVTSGVAAGIYGCIHAKHGGYVTLNGNVDVNVENEGNGNSYGVYAEDSGVELGNNNAIVNISATSKGNAYSFYAVEGSSINVFAQTANIKGAMYVDGTSTLNLNGIQDLVIEGLAAGNEKAAIQVADGGVFNVSGTLAIDEAVAGTYKVVNGVGNNTMWSNENLAYDRTELFATSEVKEDTYFVTYKTADKLTEEEQEKAQEQYVAATGGEELAVPGLVGGAAGAGSIMEETAKGAKEFLGNIASATEEVMTKETKAAVINAAAQLAEAGGNAGTAVSVASNVSNVTTGRMSFTGGAAKGGKGVGLLEEGSGAAVWTQYMHGKDEATDMPMDGGATSYESNYDGIVLGVDFKKVGKFQSGVAFNYGEGDSTGFTSAAKTKSDYDFWGIGYYGNIRNEDTNFIFDVNYAKSDSDVTQNNAGANAAIEASPETTTWSAGVKVEKLYQNNNVQIVPYTGLRYMSIDTDEYTSKLGGETLFNYAPERQDIWLLPLGVTIKQEVVNDNGWVVTPKVDLSYIWAFGDTDSNMSVSIPGIAASNDTLGFTVMDDGSFLGLVGVEAKLDDWTFGVSYSYQKGDYAESKKWFVDAKYSF